MKKIVYMLALFLVLTFAASGIVSGAGEQTSKAGAGEAICDGPGGACIIADFIGSPTDGVAPLRVQFLDSSTGYPTMWNWDFGDGNVASGTANPVHIYSEPGIYTVSLTATSITGATSTKVRQRYIIVRDKYPLEADFLANPTYGKAPLHVQFTDCSKGAVEEWRWDFGDGGTAYEQNPSHIYQRPGKYTVTLTVSSPTAGTSTKVKEKYIIVEPSCIIEARFRVDPTSGSAPLTVKFTDLSVGGPTMWEWDFGDGTTDMVANPTHVYKNPGTYQVRLTASSQTCEPGVSETTIKVNPPQIKADFSADPRSGDAPLTVRFTDLSTGNPTMWAWDFGDGATDMVANPTHVYTTPGTYSVTLTASNQYTSDTVCKTQWVTVRDVSINADFVGNPTSGYAPLTVQFTDLSTGNPTKWLWDFGDGGIIPASEDEEVTCEGGACPPPNTLQNPRHTYRLPGTYTVTLTASNQYGTSDTEVKQAYITVTANAIVADFDGTPRSGCAPLTVQFTDKSSDSPTMWNWDFGDGGIIPASTEENVTCEGGACPPPNTLQNPRHTYTVPGTYTVTLTASNQFGATGTVTKQAFITVESCPAIKADFDGVPRSGEAPLSVSFTDRSSGNPTMWAWDFGDGATDMIANPVHTYTREGKYTVTLTASSTYGSDTISKSEFITVNTPYDDLIPVSGGWNFISVPKKLAPGFDTASIFKVIDSGGHSMFQYDTGKHLWHTLDPSSPIKPLEGFWIYSKGTSSVPIRYDTNPVQTPPTAYLKKGWNGIGFTGTTPIEAKFTLLSVQDKWVNCAGFNAQAQQYDPMIIKGSNDATLMYPFRGYWLYMTADGVLAANAA
ncbi:MAG: PKD domain protein [Euryarchaeota archaeon ADurb.Bin294]|nr:MAG: PKD domain protein [Euryarchaeota archaeon ADurb.Bin294]